MQSCPRGRLVVFEGIDGCGKTTQLKAIGAWLTEAFKYLGLPAPYITKEPGGTAVGSKIRALLLDNQEPLEPLTELLLFEADRAQHVADIRRRLATGQWVLCDRYTASTVAYQTYGNGVDGFVVQTLNAITTDGIAPDLTIWFDLAPEVAALRIAERPGAADRIDAMGAEFRGRVHAGFTAQWALDRDKGSRSTWERIDADNTKTHVARRVAAVIVRRFPNVFPAQTLTQTLPIVADMQTVSHGRWRLRSWGQLCDRPAAIVGPALRSSGCDRPRHSRQPAPSPAPSPTALPSPTAPHPALRARPKIAILRFDSILSNPQSLHGTRYSRLLRRLIRAFSNLPLYTARVPAFAPRDK